MTQVDIHEAKSQLTRLGKLELADSIDMKAPP